MEIQDGRPHCDTRATPFSELLESAARNSVKMKFTGFKLKKEDLNCRERGSGFKDFFRRNIFLS